MNRSVKSSKETSTESCQTRVSRASKRRTLMLSIAAITVAALPCCNLPKLRNPNCAKPMPSSYEETTLVPIPNQGDSSAQVAWYEFYADPMLVSLINQALSDNQELRILAEDIRIAQNEVQARSGAYLPFFNLGARAGLEKSSRFTREGAVEDQLQVAPGRGFPEPLPNFLIGGNVTWEIDIWKRLRNARSAAAYRYLGTREGWNFVVTRLIADISDNYYELLALDNRLQILQNTIEIQERSRETANDFKAAGRGTELAVQRFEAEVRRNQSEKLIVQQRIIEVENEINFAAGRYPQAVERERVDYVNLSIHALSAGVPSQLLQNRADIRQAERELRAAGLDVAVARARFYPSLVLSAGVGYEAFNTRYLFDSPESLIYNTAGELVAPLINRRAIKAEYQSANARQIQAVYEYQRTVLNAFTEVINFLAAVENYGQSVEVKKQQLKSLEKSVEIATDQFQNLKSEYIDVLLAQRDLNEARLVIIETKQQQLAAIVNAFQALGGGGAPVRISTPIELIEDEQQIDDARRDLEIVPPGVPQPDPDLTEDAAASAKEKTAEKAVAE